MIEILNEVLFDESRFLFKKIIDDKGNVNEKNKCTSSHINSIQNKVHI